MVRSDGETDALGRRRHTRSPSSHSDSSSSSRSSSSASSRDRRRRRSRSRSPARRRSSPRRRTPERSSRSTTSRRDSPRRRSPAKSPSRRDSPRRRSPERRRRDSPRRSPAPGRRSSRSPQRHRSPSPQKRRSPSPIPLPAKVHVGRLTRVVTRGHLGEIFSSFGSIKEAEMPIDRATGAGRGFAYIEYATNEEAQAAITCMNGAQVDGQKITVAFVLPMRELKRISPPREGHGSRPTDRPHRNRSRSRSR
eukprot:m.194779 g.194779  ORF g.194779 m.194779 type:complete len:251 (+) comp53712_c0_seq1:23-775(+)